jgi:Tfp pilus assembly protein PilV
MHHCNKPRQQGFSYLEVMVAALLLAIALVPAMDALQAGIMSSTIHESLSVQHFQRLKKMAELQSESFDNLVAAAKVATNDLTPTSYSDAAGTSSRRLVYISLYDADANPFTITDINKDGDTDPYTGETANLIWLRVITEGSDQGLETLMSRF